MNERIAQLAEDATHRMNFSSDDLLLETSNGEVTYEIPAEFIKTFAELIIRECMDVVSDINQEYDGGSTVVNAADELREYFGVEE